MRAPRSSSSRSAAESEELLDALTPTAALDLRAEALLEKTEGNPLFLEETTRMLLEGGPVEADPRHAAGDDRGADRPAAGVTRSGCCSARP